MASGDDVQLPDLQVIQRYSLAVRGATAPLAEVIEALQADLAWLAGSGRRRAAPTTPVADEPPPAKKAAVKKPPAKKTVTTRKQTAAKAPARKSGARRA